MASLEKRLGLLEGKQILVMGLLSPQSYAWTIGERAVSEGANVIYTVQDAQTVKRTARNFRNQGIELDEGRLLACDVTVDADITGMVEKIRFPLDGLVYSIAYANPKTCLTRDIHKSPHADVLQALDISAVGLAMVVGGLEKAEKFNPNASIMAMTFDSQRTYADYGWMSVTKAALEAEVRCLAAGLGYRGIRVNSLSAGPQRTLAATHIPGFENIGQVWTERSPLGWNLDKSRHLVAKNAVFLLSDLSEGVTGRVDHVDGGFHSVALAAERKVAENPIQS